MLSLMSLSHYDKRPSNIPERSHGKRENVPAIPAEAEAMRDSILSVLASAAILGTKNHPAEPSPKYRIMKNKTSLLFRP